MATQGMGNYGWEEEFARNHPILPLSAHRISVNMAVHCFCMVDSPATLVMQMITVLPKPHLFHLCLQAFV